MNRHTIYESVFAKVGAFFQTQCFNISLLTALSCPQSTVSHSASGFFFCRIRVNNDLRSRRDDVSSCRVNAVKFRWPSKQWTKHVTKDGSVLLQLTGVGGGCSKSWRGRHGSMAPVKSQPLCGVRLPKWSSSCKNYETVSYNSTHTSLYWCRSQGRGNEIDRSSNVRTRDVREWLSTFPFPPIPIYSIPIPSHPHSDSQSLTYSHSDGILVWAIPIPSHSHSVNAKVVYN